MTKNLKIMKLIAMSLAMAFMFSGTAMAGWKQTDSRWWYENSNGSYPTNGVYSIQGKNYAFDKEGYMLENKWVEFTDGTWAYCTENGELAHSQWVGDYYLGGDGMMAVSTWTPDNRYVDSTGKMMRNSQTPDGYYVGSDGVWYGKAANK